MKKAVITSLVLAMGLSSAISHASSDRFYIKTSFGATDIEEAKTDRTLGLSLGYQFNDYVTVDLSHTDYGKRSASLGTLDTSIDTSATSISAIGSYPISDTFSVYGKLGIADWETDFRIRANQLNVNVEEDGTDVVAAIGTELTLHEHVAATLEYELLTVDPGDVDFDLETIAFGIKVVF